jgi:hypothetical protein
MHLGRERPPKTRRGTATGGWQWGSLTPQMPPSPLSTAAPTATRAAQSVACRSVAKSLTRNDIDPILRSTTSIRPCVFDGDQRHKKGNPAPVSVFPVFSRRSGRNWRDQGWDERLRRALTGLAESYRELALIWSELVL